MTNQKFRILPQPRNFQDLTDKTAAVRLNEQLKVLVNAINLDRKIETLSPPENFSVTCTRTGQALLTWDDVANDDRTELDGARIWRAAAADDPNLRFDQNNGMQLLVNCIRTTRYVDVEVDSGAAYIYWLQWVNLEGTPSGAAGGLSGTIT